MTVSRSFYRVEKQEINIQKKTMAGTQKRVTLNDVANYCGLSRSLVAFIISGSGYRNSTPENRRKVAEAVKALNYRSNTAARELRARKSSTIGVAMPMSGTGIYGNMALELQREINKRGLSSLFSFWGGDDSQEKHAQIIRPFFERNLGGVISWDPAPCFHEEKIPAVIYGYRSELYDYIVLDEEQMILKSLEHLKQFGHRKVGILSVGERNRYFREHVGRCGLETRPEWIFELTFWSRRPLDAFGKFYKECGGVLPDALICHSDTEAIAAISSAANFGIRVPEDLSMIVLDSSFMTSLLCPALDSFDLDFAKMAEQLVVFLLNRIDNPDAPLCSAQILPQLVHRKSVIERK